MTAIPRTYADDAHVIPRARALDRDEGEGPPRCCARRFVSADALVRYVDVPSDVRAKVDARFPKLINVNPLYLCDACGDTLVREGILTRAARAEALGQSPELIAKARAHDQLFANTRGR